MEDETALELLIAPDVYIENAVDVGTTQRSSDMLRFISHVRDDGLHMIDWRLTDSRIRLVAKMLARYPADEILVACARPFGQRPARLFSESIGARGIIGRFVPGTLTNPRLPRYFEPSVVFVTDPAADSQVVTEAIGSGLPIASIVDANNMLRNVDVALPGNNKGRRSLALIYWLLAREVLKERGEMDDETWAGLHELLEWETAF